MLRQTGFEWVYRLSQEPKRLTRRYLHSNSKFLMLLIRERLRLRAEQIEI
jgi:N-acetylglucosaminyldiphosphoundecaprenol N-acetyl-beta-D-mannosaminyltransferase